MKCKWLYDKITFIYKYETIINGCNRVYCEVIVSYKIYDLCTPIITVGLVK